MTQPRVFQFHSGSAVGDAVTNAMFYTREILRRAGLESEIFVEHRDPRLANELGLAGQLDPDEDDILLIRHSMGHDILPFIAELKCRKILIYHNITPPGFFPETSPF